MVQVTYEKMLQDPMQQLQKVCRFLGVAAPETLPPQPFAKQSSGNTRAALDDASWHSLTSAFKHTERAADFTSSTWPLAPVTCQERYQVPDVHAHVHSSSDDIAASVSVPTFFTEAPASSEQQRMAVTGRINTFCTGTMLPEMAPNLLQKPVNKRASAQTARPRVRGAGAGSSSQNMLRL